MEKRKHQDIETEVVDGVLRFRVNAIVKWLLDNHEGVDMNEFATFGFTEEDRAQFAQLIGYSVDGYQDLSYYQPLDEATQRAEEGCRP